jgi:PAS domain S-box-containing protein
LQAFGADVEGALERARVPAFVVDRTGIIRWSNSAAQRVIGEVQGRQVTSLLPPEDRRRGREVFTRNLLGPPEGADDRGVLLNAHGDRIEAEVCAVPLESGGHVIGLFGQIIEVDETAPLPPHPRLTPRQHDVLRLLEQGRSTAQIASELHLSPETVRNHIRLLLKALGVHSRLEAVAVARRDPLAAAPG